MLGPNTAVFSEDGRRIEPGSGERGLLALAGFLPVGYYKDEEKSAKTFRTFEGRRWSVPGDFATVDADGTLNLLGRGSQVVNTGGEKVFPEEVEEALKRHPAVRDAVVVGVPDERFGERVCAVVEVEDGAEPPTLDVLVAARARASGRLQGPARARAGAGGALAERQGRLQAEPGAGAGAPEDRRLTAKSRARRSATGPSCRSKRAFPPRNAKTGWLWRPLYVFRT